MRRSLLLFFALNGSPAALAACPGAAPVEALKSFDKDATAFMRQNNSAADMGAQLAALAASAVNTRDPQFGVNLAAALGLVSADRGSEIGSALGLMVASCSDPIDPANRDDKLYISTNISPNMLTNVAANAAYGAALDGGQSAATGGGGGGTTAGGDSGSGGQVGPVTSSTNVGNALPVDDTSSSTATVPPAVGTAGGAGIVSATPITRATVLNGSRAVSSN